MLVSPRTLPLRASGGEWAPPAGLAVTLALFVAQAISVGACMEADRRLAMVRGLASDAGLEAVPGAPEAGADADANRADVAPGATAPFGQPTLVQGLRSQSESLQDPSLSADELELYFMSPTGGSSDIWRSQRARITDPWAPATLVAELSTSSQDQDPELSRPDGLTIYFASNRGADGMMRLWFSRRTAHTQPWGPPEEIKGLGTSRTDESPSIDASGLRLMFASQRDGADYHLVMASRADLNAPWSAGEPQTGINSDYQDRDPSFFQQGTALVFASRRAGDGRTSDLFQVVRPSTAAAFTMAPTALGELNSDAWEGDTWMSEGGNHILFVSDRTGTARIYEAWR